MMGEGYGEVFTVFLFIYESITTLKVHSVLLFVCL